MIIVDFVIHEIVLQTGTINKNAVKGYKLLNNIFHYLKRCKILRIRNFKKKKENFQLKHKTINYRNVIYEILRNMFNEYSRSKIK